MTKRELIKAIQVAEAKAWKELSEHKTIFGIDSDVANRTRAQWGVLFDLREALGIPGLPVTELIELGLTPVAKTA